MAGRPSDKKEKIYQYIIAFTKEHGYPPSVREIADAVGLQSPSTVHFHIKSLSEKGLVNYEEGRARSVVIPKEVLEEHDQVPVVGNVAAGTPILAEEMIEEYLTFDTQGITGEHFALRVRGESMLNAGILPGDLVVVHQQDSFRDGDIVVALFEDEATVKTLKREKNGHIWLMPENPAYEPIDGEGASLLGKVIAVIRRY